MSKVFPRTEYPSIYSGGVEACVNKRSGLRPELLRRV